MWNGEKCVNEIEFNLTSTTDIGIYKGFVVLSVFSYKCKFYVSFVACVSTESTMSYPPWQLKRSGRFCRRKKQHPLKCIAQWSWYFKNIIFILNMIVITQLKEVDVYFTQTLFIWFLITITSSCPQNANVQPASESKLSQFLSILLWWWSRKRHQLCIISVSTG